jgi:hypothetical protein
MAYIAKVNIGDFKKGDVVPDELAVVWATMYKESPVEKSEESKAKVSIPEVKSEEVEKVVAKPAKKKGLFG